jgi:hypothetical protein
VGDDGAVDCTPGFHVEIPRHAVQPVVPQFKQPHGNYYAGRWGRRQLRLPDLIIQVLSLLRAPMPPG